jgi:hypothetical protein
MCGAQNVRAEPEKKLKLNRDKATACQTILFLLSLLVLQLKEIFYFAEQFSPWV